MDVALLRCEVTGNPFGTDTWEPGKRCQCSPCQLGFLRERVGCDVSLFVSRTCEMGTNGCLTHHQS